MKPRVTLIAALVLMLGASGCALFGGRSCQSAYRFPERFDLIQVITGTSSSPACGAPGPTSTSCCSTQ